MTISLKTIGTRAALSAIALSRLGYLLPSFGGRGVIFTLHHVRPKTIHAFDPNAHLEITPEFLDQAIITAKAAGLIPARLEDLPALLEKGDPSKRFVCFTLDDGYRNNAQFAAPVFRKHNTPYSIFICPGFVTRSRTLWWETIAMILRDLNTLQFDFGTGLETIQIGSINGKHSAFQRFAKFVENEDENRAVDTIDKLAKSIGFDPVSYVDRELMTAHELELLSTDPLCTLGGHTLTHCNLARVSPERLLLEIKDSCDQVASYSKKPVTSFAYPYGWNRAAGLREFDAARNLGLPVAVTTSPGVIKSDDHLKSTALNRVSLNGHYQNKRYVEALITGLPFKLL